MCQFLPYTNIFIFKKILFIHLFLAVLDLHCCTGFSLVAVHGLLIVVVNHILNIILHMVAQIHVFLSANFPLYE